MEAGADENMLSRYLTVYQERTAVDGRKRGLFTPHDTKNQLRIMKWKSGYKHEVFLMLNKKQEVEK